MLRTWTSPKKRQERRALHTEIMKDLKRGVLAADAALESGYWPFQVTGRFVSIWVWCTLSVLLHCLCESCHLIPKFVPKFGDSDNGVAAILPPELDDEDVVETESLPWEVMCRIHFVMYQHWFPYQSHCWIVVGTIKCWYCMYRALSAFRLWVLTGTLPD
jgi:hypothetical protein